jgi:hypothetical protein
MVILPWSGAYAREKQQADRITTVQRMLLHQRIGDTLVSARLRSGARHSGEGRSSLIAVQTNTKVSSTFHLVAAHC